MCVCVCVFVCDFNMVDGEVISECASHISVNSKVYSDITYRKNCKGYERQLKEALKN